MSGKKFSRGTNKKHNFMMISNPFGKVAKKFIQQNDKHLLYDYIYYMICLGLVRKMHIKWFKEGKRFNPITTTHSKSSDNFVYF
jgi:hypothetical protein